MSFRTAPALARPCPFVLTLPVSIALRGTSRTNAGRTAHVVTPFDDIEPAVRRGVQHGLDTPLAAPLPGADCVARPCGPPANGGRRANRFCCRTSSNRHWRSMRGLGMRVLIADEVGLGRRFRPASSLPSSRRAASRTARSSRPGRPARAVGGELRDRFAIDATSSTARGRRRASTTLPVGVNPWSTVAIAIASVDYVKRPEVRPAAVSVPWDVVIVDEAHGVAPHTERPPAAVRALCALDAARGAAHRDAAQRDEVGFDALCGLGGHAGDRLPANLSPKPGAGRVERRPARAPPPGVGRDQSGRT